MKIGDINENTILYQYEWVEQPAPKGCIGNDYKYQLCEYRLLKHSTDRVTLENQTTKKQSFQSQATFDKYFASTIEEAAMRGAQYLNKQIMDNLEKNLEYSKLLQEIMSPHIDSWCNLNPKVA